MPDVVTGGVDLDRAARLVGAAIAEVFQAVRHALLLAEAALDAVPSATLRAPILRAALDDHAHAALPEPCRAALARLGADLLAPVGIGERPLGLLALGPRRGGQPYTPRDVQPVQFLTGPGALALEQVRTRGQRDVALRRLETLEGIRASLGKFVPGAVRLLIERNPAGPTPARREADVSVLFVDIVGYTRLTERLGSERAARLVER